MPRRRRIEVTPVDSSRPTIVCVGLGGIGSLIAERCARDPRVKLVAAVDPAYAGARVGSVIVAESLSVLDEVAADVALVAVGSHLRGMAELFDELMVRGLDVVSTCEELSYPWLAEPDLASRLDETAGQHGRRIVAAGVNPGFVMDVLPMAIATTSMDVHTVSVVRQADLSTRRPQLRDKMGVGLIDEAWRHRAAQEEFGHVGLPESAHLCARGLGWPVREFKFDREPLLGDGGRVEGVREVAEIDVGDGRRIRLELVFRLGGEDLDVITIAGAPPVRVKVEGGVKGDEATVARMLAAALSLTAMAPGLRLPIEAPVATAAVP
jgi:2,4-diaminopentanoate dehydrogenase